MNHEEILEKINKEFFNNCTPEFKHLFIATSQLMKEIITQKKNMIKRSEQSPVSTDIHVGMEASDSSKMLHYFMRRGLQLFKSKISLEQHKEYALLPPEIKKVHEEMIQHIEHEIYLMILMIGNGFLDSDPFFFDIKE